MSRLSIDVVGGKIIDGIHQAANDYPVWSNGEDLLYAPEYMLSTSIARKIRGIKKHNLWVTLEHSIRDTIREARGMKQGRPSKRLQLGGRYDIVIWRKNNSPRCVIEVKHRVTGYNSLIKSDVERICTAMLNPSIKLQSGFLAFYTASWGKHYKNGDTKPALNVLEERTATLFEEIKEDPVTNKLKVSQISRGLSKEDDFASAAVVIRFDRASSS